VARAASGRRRRRALIPGLLVLLALVAAGCESVPEEPAPAEAAEAADTSTGETATQPPSRARPRARTVRVERVLDGDTLDLRNGRRIRLVQIDAPERSGECYGAQAGAVLGRLLPPGTRVVLERDAALDDVDRYGRLLRYVFGGETNVNLELVRRGAASVWFFDGDRGRYAERLLAAARRAKATGRGAWGACRARLDPTGAFETEAKRQPTSRRSHACDPSYPTVCIPPAPPDLDCPDIRHTDFVVRPPDPHGLDGNGDGEGCES
jgi:micrococcal nuclease